MRQSNKNGQSQSMTSNTVSDKNKLQELSIRETKPVIKNVNEDKVDNHKDNGTKEGRIQHQKKRN